MNLWPNYVQLDNGKYCRSVSEQYCEEKEEARVEIDQVIFVDDKYEKFGSFYL